MSGGTGILEVTADHLHELPQLKEQASKVLESTLSFGVGRNLHEAQRALEFALHHADDIQLFTEELNQDLHNLADSAQSEKVFKSLLKEEPPLNKPAAGGGMTGPSMATPAAPEAPVKEGSEHSENEALASMLDSQPSPAQPPDLAGEFSQLATESEGREQSQKQAQAQQVQQQESSEDLRGEIVKTLKEFQELGPLWEQLKEAQPEAYKNLEAVIQVMVEMARNLFGENERPIQKSEGAVLLDLDHDDIEQDFLDDSGDDVFDLPTSLHKAWPTEAESKANAEADAVLKDYIEEHGQPFDNPDLLHWKATTANSGPKLQAEHANWERNAAIDRVGARIPLDSSNFRAELLNTPPDIQHEGSNIQFRYNRQAPNGHTQLFAFANNDPYFAHRFTIHPDGNVTGTHAGLTEHLKGFYSNPENRHFIKSELHTTVEGFLQQLKGLPKDGPHRGKLITQHMNHGPFLQSLQTHPQGKQIHQMLTQFLNSKANAGPGGAAKLIAKKDLMPGGKGDNQPDSKFDANQLKTGIETEQEEHGLDVARAKEVAKDHLMEDSEYYKKAWPKDDYENQINANVGAVAMDSLEEQGFKPTDDKPALYMEGGMKSKWFIPGLGESRYTRKEAGNRMVEGECPFCGGGHTGVGDSWCENCDPKRTHGWNQVDRLVAHGANRINTGEDISDSVYDVPTKETVGVPTPDKEAWARSPILKRKMTKAVHALEAGKTGRHQVILPIGSQLDSGPNASRNVGKIKVQDKQSGKSKWRSVRAGQVMDPEGNPTSSRNPSGGIKK